MAIFRFLEPGYRFLLKWAPVFFTPALVPLGRQVGNWRHMLHMKHEEKDRTWFGPPKERNLRKLPLVEEHITAFEFLRVAILISLGGMMQMAMVAMIAPWFCILRCLAATRLGWGFHYFFIADLDSWQFLVDVGTWWFTSQMSLPSVAFWRLDGWHQKRRVRSSTIPLNQSLQIHHLKVPWGFWLDLKKTKLSGNV